MHSKLAVWAADWILDVLGLVAERLICGSQPSPSPPKSLPLADASNGAERGKRIAAK